MSTVDAIENAKLNVELAEYLKDNADTGRPYAELEQEFWRHRTGKLLESDLMAPSHKSVQYTRPLGFNAPTVSFIESLLPLDRIRVAYEFNLKQRWTPQGGRIDNVEYEMWPTATGCGGRAKILATVPEGL